MSRQQPELGPNAGRSKGAPPLNVDDPLTGAAVQDARETAPCLGPGEDGEDGGKPRADVANLIAGSPAASGTHNRTPRITTKAIRLDRPKPKPLAAGEIVDGRYRIASLLGEGGMGTVYRARNLETQAEVALKTMHPRLAHKTGARARFEREADAIERLDHENFVKILGHGETEAHTPYLAMEFLHGQSLGARMDDEGALPPDEALELVAGVLRGLGQAHARGVIHRDVKPDNVFLAEVPDEDPERPLRIVPKLLDLGLAKLLATEFERAPDKLTRRGSVFGTPAYMAPEQAQGEEVDLRADLYSTTIMLYEMLAGQRPFYASDSPALLVMHTHRPPPPLAGIATHLADQGALQALISRGLAKAPKDRFADADAYLDALERALDQLRQTPGGVPSLPGTEQNPSTAASVKTTEMLPLLDTNFETTEPETAGGFAMSTPLLISALLAIVALIGVALFAFG